MTITLYGHQHSGHAYKVALALRMFGLDYSYHWVDIWQPLPNRPQEFVTASRFGEVPLLLIDGQTLTQSDAILLYLATRTGTAISHDTVEMLFWEANRLGMCLPQLISTRRTGQDFAPQVMAWLRARYDTDIARLDTMLRCNPFVVGSQPTVADIAIFGYSHWHQLADLPIPAAVEQWLLRMQQQPFYQTADVLLGNGE